MLRETTITFNLDGKDVTATTDESIWQVARREGTTIPHLCYSPEPGYREDGNCRACMVEIEGERVLAASCVRTPTEGMVVKTATDRATRARRGVFEMLLADQPPRDSAHQKESKFWHWADAIGLDSAIRPCASFWMPASTAICACAPAEKCRSTMSSAWRIAVRIRKLFSTWMTQWVRRPAWPAENVCRPARLAL